MASTRPRRGGAAARMNRRRCTDDRVWTVQRPIVPDARVEVEAYSFAQALIVYFVLAGIIQAYLLTRLYLSREFQASDSQIRSTDTKTEEGGMNTARRLPDPDSAPPS